MPLEFLISLSPTPGKKVQQLKITLLLKGTYFLSPKQNNGDAYGAVTRGHGVQLVVFLTPKAAIGEKTHLDLLV